MRFYFKIYSPFRELAFQHRRIPETNLPLNGFDVEIINPVFNPDNNLDSFNEMAISKSANDQQPSQSSAILDYTKQNNFENPVYEYRNISARSEENPEEMENLLKTS